MNQNEITAKLEGVELSTKLGTVKLYIHENDIVVRIHKGSVTVNRVPVDGHVYLNKVEGSYKIKSYYEGVSVNKTLDWSRIEYRRGIDEVSFAGKEKLVDVVTEAVNKFIQERPELEALAALNARQREHGALGAKAIKLREELDATMQELETAWQAAEAAAFEYQRVNSEQVRRTQSITVTRKPDGNYYAEAMALQGSVCKTFENTHPEFFIVVNQVRMQLLQAGVDGNAYAVIDRT